VEEGAEEVDKGVEEDDLLDANKPFTDYKEVFDEEANSVDIDTRIEQIQAIQQALQSTTSILPAPDNSLRATVAALYTKSLDDSGTYNLAKTLLNIDRYFPKDTGVIANKTSVFPNFFEVLINTHPSVVRSLASGNLRRDSILDADLKKELARIENSII